MVKWRRKNFPKVIPRYRVDSLVAVGESVGAGLGIGAMSTYKAKSDPGLRALTPELENCSADLWVLTHPDSPHRRRIAACTAILRRRFGSTECRPVVI